MQCKDHGTLLREHQRTLGVKLVTAIELRVVAPRAEQIEAYRKVVYKTKHGEQCPELLQNLEKILVDVSKT